MESSRPIIPRQEKYHLKPTLPELLALGVDPEQHYGDVWAMEESLQFIVRSFGSYERFLEIAPRQERESAFEVALDLAMRRRRKELQELLAAEKRVRAKNVEPDSR